jgi:hypothetical protein
MPHQPIPVPNIFALNIMHLTVINNPDLLLKLFTGKLNVCAPDSKETWDWAVFYWKPALWNVHGETVTRAVPYLPSSFGRAPQDPAKKLNSGYKGIQSLGVSTVYIWSRSYAISSHPPAEILAELLQACGWCLCPPASLHTSPRHAVGPQATGRLCH